MYHTYTDKIMDPQQQALHELLVRTSGYNGYHAQVRNFVITRLRYKGGRVGCAKRAAPGPGDRGSTALRAMKWMELMK